MKLHADAADFLRRYLEMAPAPLHELGLEECRSMRMAGDLPPGPTIASVHDLVVDSAIDDPAWVAALWLRDEASEGMPVPVRVYRPTADPDLPVIVYLHGGGWSIGSVDGVDTLCRVLADRSRAVVVAVDYRQAPEHPYPAPLHDCWRVLRWVAAGGVAGVDPTRLAVGGDSAGGNLAAACALIARDSGLVQIAAQLLVYAPTDAGDASESTVTCADAPVLTSRDVDWFWGLYVPEGVDPAHATISPKNAETLAGLPPTNVITAEYDPVRDDAEDFGRRLEESGVSVLHRRFDGVYHGFFPLVGVVEAADQAAQYAAEWLSGMLDPKMSHATGVQP